MDDVTKRQFEIRAKIIKAMAHATRLFIVNELFYGERSVRELTGMIGVDISTVSRHLSVLHTAGIVDSEKRGAQVFYRLRVPCVVKFFECVESVLKKRLDEHQRIFD